MDFFNKSFDLNRIKKGQLITLTFQTGLKRSGILTAVTSETLTYSYFDEVADFLSSANVTISQVEEGTVSFVVSDHLNRVDKPQTSEKTKQEKVIGGFSTEDTTKKTSFFDTLKHVRNIDTLFKAFIKEDAQTLALIASYLNPKTRGEFLYRLPDHLFPIVKQNLNNVSNIKKDILEALESQLAEKFKRYQSNEEKTESKNEKQTSNPFDSFGGGTFGGLGGLGKLLGGINPEDLLKNFNPNDIKGMFEDKNASENQPPLPNSDQLKEMVEGMLENMPKMLSDLLGNLNNEDDDDDFGPRR